MTHYSCLCGKFTVSLPKGSDHLTEEFEAQMKFEQLKKTEEDAIKIRALTEYFAHFYSEKS